MAVVQNYLPGDPLLIDKIVYELKSQGIFDQFRKECISDVDTKPAYQNLRQRVEGSVTGFLSKQTWSNDMNKNQLREMLRKNIYESGFLETGVERIVDQVVNPKINSVFLPKVTEIVYKFFGIQKLGNDKSKSESYKSSFSSDNLLPTDLEAVSPESESMDKRHDISNDSQNLDESKVDEDESPPFEPIEEQTTYLPQEENSVDSHLSGFSGLASHDSNHSNDLSKQIQMEVSNQDSMLSKQSSDGHLSIVISDENETKVENCEDSKSSKTNDSNSKSLDLSQDNLNKSPMKQDKKSDHKSDDKSKSEKCKSHEKHRSRHDSKSDSKDRKDDKDRKSERDRKDKHISKDRDKSKDKERKDRSNSKSQSKDSKSDKDREKGDKDKRRSSSTRHSSSSRDKSSSKRDSSSSTKDKDRYESANKSKSSSNRDQKDSKSKGDSKHSKHDSKSDKNKKDDKHHSKSEKHRSSSKSKDKKDIKKDKKENKDDQCSSKKRYDRRSTDRDSNDGQPGLKSSSSSFDSYTSSQTQNKSQDSSNSNSNSNSGSGESGNSDSLEEETKVTLNEHVENMNEISINSEMQSAPILKLIKPKFASNIHEARRLMKIRRQLHKIEKQNVLELTKALYAKDKLVIQEDVSKITNEPDRKSDHKLKTDALTTPIKVEIAECENVPKEKIPEPISPPLKTAVVSAASWDALEAKLNQGMDYSTCYDVPDTPEKNEIQIINGNCEMRQQDDCLYFTESTSPKTERYVKFVKDLMSKLQEQVKSFDKVSPNNQECKCDLSGKVRKSLSKNSIKRKITDIQSDVRNNNKKFHHIEVHENFSLPLSPAESDKSIDKKSDSSESSEKSMRKSEIESVVKPKRIKAKTQRYSNEDLYKPRPLFSGSRRRTGRNLGID